MQKSNSISTKNESKVGNAEYQSFIEKQKKIVEMFYIRKEIRALIALQISKLNSFFIFPISAKLIVCRVEICNKF